MDEITKENVSLFSTDVDKAWLKNTMRLSVVKVTFTKKDGTERVMNCTLDESIIPAVVAKVVVEGANTVVRAVNDDVVPVYDVDAKGWRSFRWDSIKAVDLEYELLES